MKRNAPLRFLRKHGCNSKREGSAHSLWINPLNGVIEAIPRHSEIADKLVRKFCKRMDIPDIKE